MRVHETIAVVVFNSRNKILLLREKRKTHLVLGKWVIPGGHAEPGEDSKKAARREIKEEVGNVALSSEIASFMHTVPGHKHNCHVFLGRMKSKPKICRDEASGYKWADYKTIGRMNLAKWSLYAIELISKKKDF